MNVEDFINDRARNKGYAERLGDPIVVGDLLLRIGDLVLDKTRLSLFIDYTVTSVLSTLP